MTKMRIEHGAIATLDSENTILMDGAIVVDGNQITAIGRTDDIRRRHDVDRVIDAQGKVVMPGLVNVHTHIAAPIFRAFIEEQPGALYNIAFPIEELLSPDDIYVLSLLGCLETIRFGATCINDIYHHSSSTAKAIEDVGSRAVLAHKVFDIKLSEIGQGVHRHVPEEGERRMKANIQLIEEWHGGADGRITCRIGTHAADTCTPDLLRRGRTLADEYGVGLHIHTAQSDTEVAHIENEFGEPGSIEFLHNLGFLGPDVIAVHCTRITDEGVRLLGETGTTYAMCPTRYPRGGVFPPLLDMLDAGITTGIGTDWIRMDPWESMRATISAVRLKEPQRGQTLTVEDVLGMATMGSARVLGLDHQIGSLEVGKRADLILIDMQQPHLVPLYEDSLIRELVYHVNGNDVDTVIVDGQMLMENNQFVTIDEHDVLSEAQRVCDTVRDRARQQLGL